MQIDMQTDNQTNTSSHFHRPDALPDAQPTVSKHGRTPLLNRHTHTRLTALFWDYPGEPVPERQKPIWILLKQETLSSSGISWAICESAPRSRQTTMPAPHHSVFTSRMPFLLPNNSVKALKCFFSIEPYITYYRN